jgi:hypothetical protein
MAPSMRVVREDRRGASGPGQDGEDESDPGSTQGASFGESTPKYGPDQSAIGRKRVTKRRFDDRTPGADSRATDAAARGADPPPFRRCRRRP